MSTTREREGERGKIHYLHSIDVKNNMAFCAFSPNDVKLSR